MNLSCQLLHITQDSNMKLLINQRPIITGNFRIKPEQLWMKEMKAELDVEGHSLFGRKARSSKTFLNDQFGRQKDRYSIARNVCRIGYGAPKLQLIEELWQLQQVKTILSGTSPHSINSVAPSGYATSLKSLYPTGVTVTFNYKG
ncbi:hypothetical protein Anapl_16037 [Anas platyrhynchos]|uniref:Uncharacterized protein n=1 Tax=Anas platyrhynchos TaxID=8839 RepID=R0L1I3_ANAPL|nr:hypothetical protein Anapl_16037 [Anas platyrhynchos]